MRVQQLGSYGGAMAVLGIAALQLLFAGSYLASCELRAKGPGQCEPQWIAAQALLFGAGGTTAGLFTKNPLLHSSSGRSRDGRGRFASTDS